MGRAPARERERRTYDIQRQPGPDHTNRRRTGDDCGPVAAIVAHGPLEALLAVIPGAGFAQLPGRWPTIRRGTATDPRGSRIPLDAGSPHSLCPMVTSRCRCGKLAPARSVPAWSRRRRRPVYRPARSSRPTPALRAPGARQRQPGKHRKGSGVSRPIAHAVDRSGQRRRAASPLLLQAFQMLARCHGGRAAALRKPRDWHTREASRMREDAL